METKENIDMARIGKIARLPGGIRSQLNSRLQDGVEGKQIVLWLNSLPEVKKILAQSCDGRPISEQNLSQWRQGGYEEWLAWQDILAHASELAENQEELQEVAPGRSFTDHLAGAVAFRYAAILARQGLELDEPSLRQLRSLGRACQAVVKLRRSDQNAARLKIETERWERVREQMDSDRADALKRRQREALAAPVWGALKKAERFVQFGGGKGARLAADLLEEIDNCPDPAHFDSKVLASLDVAELRRDIEEMAKNPPQQKTPVQAAAEMLEEMDAYVAKSETEAQPAQPRKKARRRARKPAPCRPARRAKPVRAADVAAVYDRRQLPVPPAEPAQPGAVAAVYDRRQLPVHPVQPDIPASSQPLEPALSTAPPPAAAAPPIKPNQT
jgi:hypothetical protein